MQSDALPFLISNSDMQPNDASSEAANTIDIDPTVWVDDHGDYLFRYAVVRLRDEAQAEDAVQETLLAAIQTLGSYGGKSTERTWLTGILKHKIIDHYRKSSREVPLNPSETDLSEFDPLFERQDDFKDHWSDTLSPRIWNRPPDEALQENEFFGVLQSCLTKLPERVANVFSLREMNGLEAGEICEILALSANNFWVMMHRARMSLRRCIEINWFMKAK
ncbi:MAG: sigma-70 family RNA polymerase sigma factor [Acidobacteriota bacterium]